MSNYKIGRIYKIIHNQSNICYVGSTFNTLRDRWMNHKSDYNRYLDNRHNEIAIYPYFFKYGIENFKIILIKEYEVCDRKHLHIYEQLWINKLKTINKLSTFQINKLYIKFYESNRRVRPDNYNEERRGYRIKNQDEIRKIDRQRYHNNKEVVLERRKEYYIRNKDKIQERKKDYYEKSKKRFLCACGSNILECVISSHLKTKKHQNYINSL